MRMLVIFVVGFVVIVLFAIIAWLVLARPAAEPSREGNTSHLVAYIDGLQAAPDGAFLVVGVARTEDFFQFSAGSGVVQLDMPVITERQKQVTDKFRATAQRLGLAVQENAGSDGSLFLDMDLQGSSQEIASAVSEMLAGVFGVNQDSILEFTCSGFRVDQR